MRSRLGILLILLAVSAQAQEDDPHLTVSTTSSDTGTYTVSWEASGAVLLQESTRADFADARLLYEGVDRATVVSGRLNGTYHYRLLRDGVPWGEAVTVDVAHHSLKQATAFLGAGAVVFIATVILIVQGHRRHRREFMGSEAST